MNIRKYWRWNISPKARTLFAVVTVAGIATLIAIIALLYSSLDTIAAKANDMDAARANDAAEASIQTSLTKMTALVEDNSAWDDAVAELYKPVVDTNWLYSTWGAVSDDAKPYDGTFLTDENGNILWGYFRGKPYVGGNQTIFGTEFRTLVSAHSQELASGSTAVSGLTATPYGVAIIGIGMIHPTEHALTGKGTMKRYLVMTRHLTPAMLGDLSHTFRIDGLRLAPTSDTNHPYLQLSGADGVVVGHLTWKLRLPGAEAAQAAAPKIQQITWLVAGLILMFIAVSAYSLHKLGHSEKDARTIALTDNLSGLPNRHALFERLKSRKAGVTTDRTVVFIDLDGFKDVNDIYGHTTGDKLIMVVAAALKSVLPEGCFLARMGGDEFAMLASGSNAAVLGSTFARAALEFLKKPIRIGERTIQIGASIGIASADIKACPAHELFRRADMAMYTSKTAGKARITHYDGEIEAARIRRQELEIGIREGLKRNEFAVAYQPVVDARTQDLTGVEALVRWPRRPEGSIGPDRFISIAETSGLIHPLGQFVLRQACEDLQDIPDIRLSVNISPVQFRDPEFEHKVATVLRETGFPPERLELEVTENYLIENPERAIVAISALKALGVSIALDDFGTGCASIGYLRRYKFDTIKIDRSLAGLVDTDPQAAALVAGTVSIATALQIKVTAEGVETEDHARLLRLAGCDKLQGFYFSRPAPLNEIMILRNRLPKTA